MVLKPFEQICWISWTKREEELIYSSLIMNLSQISICIETVLNALYGIVFAFWILDLTAIVYDWWFFSVFPLTKYKANTPNVFCLDCILVGSLFWGLWTRKDSSHNYYKAYITKVNVTHLDFALEFDKAYTRSYNRTDQVLITDESVEVKDISVNSRVIAVHRPNRSEWYRTGTITLVSSTKRLVQVKFDDGLHTWVPLEQVRLVKRPVYCKNNI